MTVSVRTDHPTVFALGGSLLLLTALGVCLSLPARAADPAPAAPSAAAPAPTSAGPGSATRAAVVSEVASPAARVALEQLLGAPAEAEPGEPAADARTTTVVRAGETLDVIIRRTLGNTPFKENLLRAAFVEANPRLYPNGNIQRLPNGTKVQVPSAADLRRHLLRSLGPERAAALAGRTKPAVTSAPDPAPVVAAAPPSSAAATPPSPPPPPRPDHRGWVRFPG
jgi:pilus assembly protein FimV